jgi:hypothetical protein
VGDFSEQEHEAVSPSTTGGGNEGPGRDIGGSLLDFTAGGNSCLTSMAKILSRIDETPSDRAVDNLSDGRNDSSSTNEDFSTMFTSFASTSSRQNIVKVSGIKSSCKI